MAVNDISSKRLQIDKANTTMVIVVAASSFIFVFSLIATKALWSQRGYQQRVISKKEKARDQLKANVTASKTLVTAYQSFITQQQNVIGGSSTGTGAKDGDNGKIVLDALPSKYDFPALANSLSNLLTTSKITTNNISGNDDELAQENNAASNDPKAVSIPFDVSVTGSSSNIQNLITIFEKSIRPITINSLSFSGSDSSLTLAIKGNTYYQPAKSLTISTEVVK